jgi:hypothetical protein
MGLNKDQLVLDTAALAESDNVGAYLRASDGTLLTHTTVGAKQALDVNVANTVVVSATALDVRALAFATDKVDASGSTVELGATSLAALENISATVSGTVEIGATSLAALESITVQNGAGVSAVNIQDGGNSITVDATAFDIRALAFATDKVDVGGSVVALDAPTLAALESITAVIGGGVTAAFSAVAVDATVGGTDLVAVDLASRKKILIQNVSSKAIYVGNSGVTTATGIKVAAGSSAEFDAGPAINLFAITASGAADVRIMEVA